MQMLYRLSYVGPDRTVALARRTRRPRFEKVERETGFEPATLSLEG